MKFKSVFFLLALLLSGCGNGEPLGNPVCGSSANPTSGQNQLTVQFTENAQGSIIQYIWDFGDLSTPSQEENPLHTYSLVNSNIPQQFDAVLTVVGFNGSQITCDAITITVNAATS